MIIGALIGCYLIGSIPQAWLITKLVTGKDLRQMGSGNLGVTNTALSVARWAGLLVFLGELAKGMVAVLLMRAAGGSELMVALGLLAAVAGTRWSIWLGFAGGRGNTTGSGGLLLISLQILLGNPGGLGHIAPDHPPVVFGYTYQPAFVAAHFCSGQPNLVVRLLRRGDEPDLPGRPAPRHRRSFNRQRALAKPVGLPNKSPAQVTGAPESGVTAGDKAPRRLGKNGRANG